LGQQSESADNLFTRVGATFLFIVCLSMYLGLSGLTFDQRFCVGAGAHYHAARIPVVR
jgi:hypothetical protein